MNGYDRLSLAAKLCGLGFTTDEASNIATDPELTPAKAKSILDSATRAAG